VQDIWNFIKKIGSQIWLNALVDGGQPTYLTNLRKKEKPCGPAGKEQIGSKAPIAGRDGPGPGRGGEGREWRTGNGSA
jgi:hypothetical protein